MHNKETRPWLIDREINQNGRHCLQDVRWSHKSKSLSTQYLWVFKITKLFYRVRLTLFLRNIKLSRRINLQIFKCTGGNFGNFERSNEWKFHLLVTVRTNSCRFVELCTIYIWAIVKSAISFSYWPSPTLVHEMPVETSKRSMLCTFVLQKQRALLCSKLFQVPAKYKTVIRDVILAKC